jgi:hypothetical protein
MPPVAIPASFLRVIPINRSHPSVEAVCNVLDAGLAFSKSPVAVAESPMSIERRHEACVTAIRKEPAGRLVNATPRDFGIPWPRPIRRQGAGASWRARPGSSWERRSWPRIGR